MSYVFFDLEWNQGYPRSEAEKIDEIIQFGAHRLDSWEDGGVSFSAYVRPSIHKKLHHQVRKMVPLEADSLKRAGNFRQVAAQFFRWCGEGAEFFTWGTCDARVLDTNLCWYGMEEYLDLEIYDLQRAFDLLVLHTCHQTALETAVAALGLDAELTYHDAGHDAFYTARIGAELVRRFGPLPSEEELDHMEAALRRQQRLEAVQTASQALEGLLSEEQPALRRKCGQFSSPADCLKSRSARVFHCPQCDNWLCSGNWYQVSDYYVARSRCPEHGRFLSCLTVNQTAEGSVDGLLQVFPEDVAPDGLFHQCKVGGTLIEVKQMPRKRRRNRKNRDKARRELS